MPVRTVVDRLVLVAAMGWTVAVCVLSLTPSDPSDAIVGWDKARHGGAYAGLTVLWLAAGRLVPRPDGSQPGPGSRTTLARAVAAALAVIALGIMLEVLQATVANRSGDALDAVADAAGAVAGLGAWLLVGDFVTRSGARARLRSPDRTQSAASSPSPNPPSPSPSPPSPSPH